MKPVEQEIKPVSKSKEQEAHEMLQTAFLEKKELASKEINDILNKHGLGLKIVQTIELVPQNG